MYGWIWRHLPGPPLAKALISLVLLTGVILLLWYVAFPYLGGYQQDPGVLDVG